MADNAPPGLFRDQAIEADIEDQFSRGRFIDGIVDALVHDHRSTGITIGIVGRWGEGKTSVLNLLHKRIVQREDDAVVFCFNPWVVANRDDLIAAFFKTLIAGIKDKHEKMVHSELRSQTAEEVGKLIAEYGASVTPLLNHYQPGAGWVAKFFHRIFKDVFDVWLKTNKTPEKLKARIEGLLRDLAAPIVVLIDEVDRVEDDDVRKLAQLVRAVADFKSISYVMAYDEARVVEALGVGGQDRNERVERGKRYLEKIVQIPIALPIIFDDELRELLIRGLKSVLQNHHLKEADLFGKKFDEIVEIMIPTEISNARDVYRLISNFAVRMKFVAEEIRPLDVLVYIMLQMRAPELAAYIRHWPDRFVYDGHDTRWYLDHEKDDYDKKFDAVTESASERRPAIKELISKTFGGFSREYPSSTADRSSIAFLRPLLTLLRMGLLPNAVARVEILRTVNADDVDEKLSSIIKDNRLEVFLARLNELRRELTYDIVKFWVALFHAIERTPAPTPKNVYEKEERLRNSVETLSSMASHEPRHAQHYGMIIEQLMAENNLFAAVDLARSANHMRPDIRKTSSVDHLTHSLIAVIRTIERDKPLPTQFVYLLNDMGLWSLKDRDIEASHLEKSDEYLDRFVTETFGGLYSSTRSGIELFIPVAEFQHAAQQRLEAIVRNEVSDDFLIAAYSKALKVSNQKED